MKGLTPKSPIYEKANVSQNRVKSHFIKENDINYSVGQIIFISIKSPSQSP